MQNIPSPSNDPFKDGQKFAELAVETRQDAYLAREEAFVASLGYRRPQTFLDGFLAVFITEMGKRSAA